MFYSFAYAIFTSFWKVASIGQQTNESRTLHFVNPALIFFSTEYSCLTLMSLSERYDFNSKLYLIGKSWSNLKNILLPYFIEGLYHTKKDCDTNFSSSNNFSIIFVILVLLLWYYGIFGS